MAAMARGAEPLPPGSAALPPGSVSLPGSADIFPPAYAAPPEAVHLMPSPESFHAVYHMHQTIADSVGDNGELTGLGMFFPHALDDGLWYFDWDFEILEDAHNPGQQTLNFEDRLGFGRRWLEPADGQVFGVSVWYDADRSRPEFVHQVSVGTELLGEVWDWRTNAYFPIGTARTAASPGTDIVALTGIDMEFGRRLPGWFGENGISAYSGWYYYRADRLLNAFGGSTRLEVILSDTLKVDLRATSDPVFKTNLSIGITYALPTAGKCKTCNACSPEYLRLTEPIERNHTVVRAPQRLF